MVTVPAATTVTIPVALTVAFEGLLLLHVPPVAVSVNGVVRPVHTEDAPVITPAAGSGRMVTRMVAEALPQLPATV